MPYLGGFLLPAANFRLVRSERFQHERVMFIPVDRKLHLRAREGPELDVNWSHIFNEGCLLFLTERSILQNSTPKSPT